MLITIPNVLSEHELQQYRQHLNSADWENGLSSAGAQSVHVKQNQQLNPESKLAQQLGDHILQVLSEAAKFVSAALPLKISSPMFNCYQNGGHYGWHVDNAIRIIPGTPVRLRTDLSATIFLNDSSEYEGGELCIKDTYGEHQIKLQAGDMVLYPSTSLHQVLPVTKGQRLASFLWIESMVRDHEQREILFDLDQNIQVLGTEHGLDNPQVVSLSALYHRLIRLHVDT
ncbi:MAG: Fe2+-dependent dioxygenase [Gammaproteobacteria bacterium]|nr:Fe2+-dependent dioxygenase [Gammaproteobacteria bacterium]MBU1467104.1 Fe2+-dependent dioxygenase [Gammaproteobacteria bacterium]MBU2021393.1 Fe2+-dependent dioxygenase [Gammaproteobacteria bacterium]MBU2239373.1 Fe2+-dependent dioxygenase [Gammaproteobacteria bacterium]MBU2318733.1 Fe2+-dependent dioxygenase [Gammaproteobacteria bacterium]